MKNRKGFGHLPDLEPGELAKWSRRHSLENSKRSIFGDVINLFRAQTLDQISKYSNESGLVELTLQEICLIWSCDLMASLSEGQLSRLEKSKSARKRYQRLGEIARVRVP